MKFIDQMNNTILLSDTPKRIVSLVPSITELLVDLGLENNLIGITKFCVEPSYLKSKIQTQNRFKSIQFGIKIKGDIKIYLGRIINKPI